MRLALFVLCAASFAGCVRKLEARVVEVPGPRVADDLAVQGRALDVPPPIDSTLPPPEDDESPLVRGTVWQPPAEFELPPGGTKELAVAAPEAAYVIATCTWQGTADALDVTLSNGAVALGSSGGERWNATAGQTTVRLRQQAAGSFTVSVHNPGAAILRVRAFLGYTPLRLLEGGDS
jgi:hypothetical protein